MMRLGDEDRLSDRTLAFRGRQWLAMTVERRWLMSAVWWHRAFPDRALIALVMAINLLGDGSRDALDPRMKA